MKVCALSSLFRPAVHLRLHPPPRDDRSWAALVGYSYSRQAEQEVPLRASVSPRRIWLPGRVAWQERIQRWGHHHRRRSARPREGQR